MKTSTDKTKQRIINAVLDVYNPSAAVLNCCECLHWRQFDVGDVLEALEILQCIYEQGAYEFRAPIAQELNRKIALDIRAARKSIKERRENRA